MYAAIRITFYSPVGKRNEYFRDLPVGRERRPRIIIIRIAKQKNFECCLHDTKRFRGLDARFKGRKATNIAR